MARCGNDVVLAKIGQKKLESNQEIDFSVRRPLPDCRKINTKKAIGVNVPYRAGHKPVNRFECMPDGCSTSGTATIEAPTKYFVSGDANEWASGVITMYAESQTYPVTVIVKISDTDTFTDADVYEMELTENMKTDDGFIPLLIKLTDDPTSVEGNGWTASTGGAYIQIEANDGTTAIDIGVSTISILDSIMDFTTNATVKVACISSAGGSYDLSVIEQTCRDAELDDTISQLSFPITCKLMTPNWYLLSPMYGETDREEGFKPITAEKTVEEYVVGTQRYGRILLSDADATECRFYGVQLADSCSPFEAQMTELTIPTLTVVPEGHFQVVRNADGVQVFFNESYIGIKMLVEYPQIADVTEFTMGTDALNEVKTSMTVPYRFDGDVEELHVYDHVLVTGFPFGLSNADQDITFTITVMKKDGKFFRIQRYE